LNARINARTDVTCVHLDLKTDLLPEWRTD
jgi:hypothetical protein